MTDGPVVGSRKQTATERQSQYLLGTVLLVGVVFLWVGVSASPPLPAPRRASLTPLVRVLRQSSFIMNVRRLLSSANAGRARTDFAACCSPGGGHAWARSSRDKGRPGQAGATQRLDGARICAENQAWSRHLGGFPTRVRRAQWRKWAGPSREARGGQGRRGTSTGRARKAPGQQLTLGRSFAVNVHFNVVQVRRGNAPSRPNNPR